MGDNKDAVRKRLLKGIVFLVFFTWIGVSTGKAQTADFTVSPATGTSPLVAQFSDQSTGATSWFWNFGNGNTSTLQNPSAVYVSAGTYTVSLTVSNGTSNDTKTSNNLITVYAATAPTLGISSASAHVNGAFTATLTFSEAVTGFELADIVVTNGTASNLIATSASVYTAEVTPSVAGQVKIDVAANAVQDVDSEGNVPATQFCATYDITAPGIVISTAAASPVAAAFTATFTFDEEVTGFDISDITVANGLASNFSATTAAIYTATITPLNDGAVTIAVGANAATDLAGNNSTAATQFMITADVPSVFTDGPIQLMVRVREIEVTNGPTDEAVFGVAFATEEYNFKLWGRDNASLDNADWIGGDLLMEDFIPPGNTSDFNNEFYSVTYPTGKVPQFLDLRLEAWEDERGDQIGGIGTSTSRSTYNTNFCVGSVLFGSCLGLTTSDDNYFLGDAFISELDYRQGAEGVWFDHGFLAGTGTGVNGYKPRIETFWQRVTPATTDLGTINAGNSAVGNGDNTSSGNNWPDNPGNDVFHTFTITEELGVGIALNTSFGSATTYLINSDGTIIDTGSQSSDISATNLSAGTYSVVVDANLTTNIGIFTLTVGALKAGFSLNPDTGCAVPHLVAFTDTSVLIGGGNSWLWNFGDANTSTVQNPIHNYTATGDYTVSLTVTNTTTGASDTFTDQVTVSTAATDFTGAPLFGCGPLSVDFTDASTPSAGTTITGWSWNFGDGGISTDQNPTYVYDTPGIYAVTLTTTDSNGCTNTKTKANYVQVIGPDVDFRATNSTIGDAPLNVAFQDRTIFGAPITRWTWNFGDGGSSNLQNPSHTYNSTGVFDVSLTVTDIDGCSRTLTKTNFVNTIPGAYDVSEAIFTGNHERFSVAGVGSLRSIAFNNDGTQMYVLGANRIINEYQLSIAFDVTTAVFTGDGERFSVTSQNDTPFSMIFNTDGTKLFAVNFDDDDIDEYDLSTPFDISTAVYAGDAERLTIRPEENQPGSIAFSSDGLKLFVAGSQGDDITEYSLSAAFDVSTATPATTFSIASQTGAPNSVAFRSDGNQMFILDIGGDFIYKYNLTTSFDLSSAVFAGNAERLNVRPQDTTPRSIAFSNDGTRLYVLGEDGSDINTYSLAAPVITGAVAAQAVNDNATMSPFSSVTVQDPNGDNVSATILLDDNAKGVLTGTGLSGTGPYTLVSTDAASLQTSLRSLVFNPTDNRAAISETTNFTLTVTDGTFSDVDNVTTVVSSAVAPTVAITSGAADPVNGAFTATFTFSEDVTGFAVGDITVGNGSASGFTSSSANVYTATITPTASGAATLDVAGGVSQDSGGADNTAATQFSIAADLTAPTLTITSTATDPTNAAITATFTFSEAVTGFDINDITVMNGAASSFSATSTSVYTATITPATTGSMTVDVAANVAQDAAGNNNTAATQFSIAADLTAPTLTITSTATDPTNAAITATFTFSEAITGFDVNDITVGNGAASNFSATSTSVYAATITPAATGSMTIDVAANIAQDAAGNNNTAAAQFSIAADLTAPTVTITSTATDPTNAAITGTFTFSEAVTGFDVTDITVGNGTANNFSATSTSIYTATITPAATGSMTIDVAANVAQDAAGNNNTAATQFSIAADLTAPTLIITSTATDPTNAAITATFTFSEAVTGFDINDITVGNGATSNFSATSTSIYTATITPTATGSMTIDVAANVAQDAAGNNNTAATQFSIEADLTAPTLTITSTATDPTNAAITATFTFSEAVTGFDINDITIANGAASNFSVTSTSVYTATITPAATGSMTIDVAANVAQDAAGNNNTAAAQFSIAADLTAPSVTIISTATDPTNAAIMATFTFSEAVTSFDINDITVSNGTTSNFNATNTSIYTATVTPTATGSMTIDVAANVAQDAAGNNNIAAAQFSIAADLTAPTVTITSTATDPTNGAIMATFMFSEAVTGFDVNDITVSNGAASNFSATSTSIYTATVTPTATGSMTIDVAANVAQDAAGNNNTAAAQFSIAADLTAPTLNITSTATDPTNAAIMATFTFSEAITGFDINDITVGNGAASNFSATSTSIYTATVTPTATGSMTIDVAANVAQDAAGNNNTAAAQFSIAADLTAPTLTITSTATDPTNAAITATFTFSEAVTGFDINDITIANGAASNFNATSTSVYTATITPTATGSMTIDVAANVATDAASNGNTAATQFSIAADLTAPTLTITSTATDPTNAAITATFTFSEAITGFDVNDITVSNGAASNFSATSTSVYTATITPAATGSMTIDVAANVAQDAAGNNNTAAIQFSIEADLTAPTVTITSTATDPTNAAITATFTFSEAVTGFDVNDITVSNGAASNFNATNTSIYTATVTPTATGSMAIDVAANVAQDAAGNNNTAAAQFSIAADLTAPTLTITSTATDPTNGAIMATFTFSEAVTGFDINDITVMNGAASSFSATSTSVYTATITPATTGSMTVDVAANVAQDAAGNNNTAAAQFSIAADLTAPTLTITSTATDPTNAAITATFTFSEAITGFDVNDITVSNGTASNFSATSTSVYAATITPAATGSMTIDVAANVAQDAAGNNNTAAAQFSIEADLTAPTVTITSTATDPTNGAITATFTFSEAVTGFDVDDITIANGAASNFSATSTSVYTATITPAATGSMTVDVAANVAQDAAGNYNTAATQFSIATDLTAPTLTITSTATDPTNAAIAATFTFSEAVTGFDINDITIANGAASNFSVTSTSVYTAAITPAATGSMTVDVAANVATDEASNGNTAATTFSIIADLTPPTVNISSTSPDPTNGSFLATFTFSEPVTGFAIGDIVVANGTTTNFAATSTAIYTATITPTTDGSVTVDVPSSVAIDAASNGNLAATQFSVGADFIAPTATVQGVPAELNDFNTFTLTYLFSEPIVDFTSTDFSLTNATISDFTSVSPTTFNVTLAAITNASVIIELPVNTVRDLAGNANTEATTATIDFNSLPTDISLSATAIDENNELAAEIGTLTTADADIGDMHTYSLVSGMGDTDNNVFSITFDKLRAATRFDFESQASYSIRVRSDDGNGGSIERAFTITINDANELPTDILISNDMIEETDLTNVLVGLFSATDEDQNETFTFELISGAGDANNGEFTIAGDQLLANGPINFEENELFSIRVKAIDSEGGSFEKIFEIVVTNVDLEPLRDFTTDRPDARVKNFFTPNADGQNDVWVIEDILDNPQNEVKVFATGGKLVFSTRNYQNDWAGTFNGSVLPSGSYYYEINVFNGESIIRGILLILNK